MMHIDKQGHTATITIDTNEKNTFDQNAFTELSTALKSTAEDPSVKALVLTGSGERFFSNGFEPSMFIGRSYEEICGLLEVPMNATKDLLFFPKPVVCLINGHCMGVGAIIALYADYRIMVEGKARFGFPESRIGLNFPSVPGFVLKELIGLKQTADILYSGRPLKTSEALQTGLVDELTEPDQSAVAVEKYCSQFEDMAMESVLGVKKSLRDYMIPTVEFLMKNDTADLAKTISSANGQEGMKSILEKRKPVFT